MPAGDDTRSPTSADPSNLLCRRVRRGSMPLPNLSIARLTSNNEREISSRSVTSGAIAGRTVALRRKPRKHLGLLATLLVFFAALPTLIPVGLVQKHCLQGELKVVELLPHCLQQRQGLLVGEWGARNAPKALLA